MCIISIITPCYNSEQYIERTIQSVRAQTLKSWEHIIVDDGSTDASVSVVEAYLAAEPRLRLVRQQNGGVCTARNKGYRAISTSSPYVYFLDQDDCPEPAMLQTMTDYLEAHPEAGMAYCKPRFVDAQDHSLPENEARSLWEPRRIATKFWVAKLAENHAETSFASIFALCSLLPALAIFRRSAYERAGGWDEDFGQCYEDTDLFLRVALHSQVHYLSDTLLRYRRHPHQFTASGTSGDRVARQEQKLYAKWRRMNGFTPEQQKQIAEAFRFLEGRVAPSAGLQAGITHLKRGQWRKALRFCGGAARRYAASLV